MVDLRSQRAQLLVDQAVLLVQLVIEGIEGLAQPLGLGKHCLARFGRGGIVGGGLQCGEEALHGRADAGGGVGQQAVELLDLATECAQLAVLAGGVAQLAGEEVTGQAAHVDDLAARAHVAGTAELRDLGLLDGILAAVARRLDVGDVVPGDGQPGLAGAEAGQAYRVGRTWVSSSLLNPEAACRRRRRPGRSASVWRSAPPCGRTADRWRSRRAAVPA